MNKFESIVFNQDCIEVMKRYPDKFFDLAVVDPPYGINADVLQNKTAMSRIKANGKTKSGRGWKLYKETSWDKERPSFEYWNELLRISKNQIVWGGNYFVDFLRPSMGWIVWDKGQRDFSLADAELAYTSFEKAIRIFEMSRAKSLAKNNEEGGRFHPTQKPVDLYDWIFFNYSKEGQFIFDSHLGSGSSRIAADKNKLNFIGCEIDPDYFQKQEKRFLRYKSQLKLF
jgi:site-specific DNA-methyltransferase (adenine-specific)